MNIYLKAIAVFLAAHAQKPPVGTHLTWRVESQAQEQIEKLNRTPRAASPNGLAASIGIRAQLRLAILPD